MPNKEDGRNDRAVENESSLIECQKEQPEVQRIQVKAEEQQEVSEVTGKGNSLRLYLKK